MSQFYTRRSVWMYSNNICSFLCLGRLYGKALQRNDNGLMDYGDIAFYILGLHLLKIGNILYWFLNLSEKLRSLVYLVIVLWKGFYVLINVRCLLNKVELSMFSIMFSIMTYKYSHLYIDCISPISFFILCFISFHRWFVKSVTG